MTVGLKAHKAGVFALLGALVASFGLWVAFRYVMAAWPPDPDVFVTVELWRGIQRHGLEFASSWSYTQDNWLLTVVPLSSALYQLLGPSLTLTIAIGWLTFATAVVLAGWLVAELAGWRWGLALSAVLAYGNLAAVGRVGYLGYPISHNASMAWALAVLLTSLRALKPGPYAWSWSALAGVLLFADAVSDPWAAAAVALPMIMTLAGLAFVRRQEPVGPAARALLVAVVIATVAARTRGFGLLGFLPRTSFALTDPAHMLVNLYWAYRASTAMFHIVPGASAEPTLPRLIDAAALLVLLGWASASAVAQIRRARPDHQFITAVALLSIGITSALYLVARWDPNMQTMVGRFFPNLYFLGGVLVAVAAAGQWPEWRLPPKLLLAGYAALFMTAGLAGAPEIWTGKTPPATADEARNLGRFLDQHHLAYGFGPFWGSQSLLMRTATDEHVTIRPVSFQTGRIVRRGAETSSHWYGPGADSAPSRQFLLIRNDGEECPSPQACVAMARQQFGPEAELLTYLDMSVLVWTTPISTRIGM